MFNKRFTQTAFVAAGLIISMFPANASVHFQPGSDITGELETAVASGENGIGPNRATIELPAGTFRVTRSINLHGSTLSGEGPDQTVIMFTDDLGKDVPGFTGDAKRIFGPFTIKGLKLEAPRRAGGVHSGDCPNQMDGIHLYNNCKVADCSLQYFNSALVIDGNHHSVTDTAAQANYIGVHYVLSSDRSYMDDYYENCSFTANGLAGVKIDDTVPMGGATYLRVHTGFEPYAFLLGSHSTINGCQFLQTQFEGVGNADFADTDGTSTIAANYFASCSGWGGRYNNRIERDPITPSLRCGTFLSNVIFCSAMQGPTPSDLRAAMGMYGNTWICDAITGRDIKAGKFPPIYADRRNMYDNTLIIGGVIYKSLIATASVAAGQDVQGDSDRTPGCEPVLKGTVIGRALGPAHAGDVAWISTAVNSLSESVSKKIVRARIAE